MEGNVEEGDLRVEGTSKWRQVWEIQDRKTVKGSQTTRMGEGGEIKPHTLVAVCGLLATLSAMHLLLSHWICTKQDVSLVIRDEPGVKLHCRFTWTWFSSNSTSYVSSVVLASVSHSDHTTLLLILMSNFRCPMYKTKLIPFIFVVFFFFECFQHQFDWSFLSAESLCLLELHVWI